ncbi:MAG: hypothetical protein IJ368_08040 [Oscillospiraceae bacterium]|nr:hypothetical protein [Oscillospiraceae bacterium]
MLRKLIILLSAAILFAACGKETPYADSQAAVHSEPTANAMPLNVTETVTQAAQPFSQYTFELRGTKENYMIIIGRGKYTDEISVSVENNRYESKNFIITAPSGYEPVFPSDHSSASKVVNVITNDIDDTYIPDIMQFIFASEADSGEDGVKKLVSRMYTVDDRGELREINIIGSQDNGDGTATEVVRDYLDRTQLYHSEPDKFIYEIAVDESNIYNDDGSLRHISSRVKIKTLTFDHTVPCFVEGLEIPSEDNPLYFGYAYWAAANSVSQYFTMTSLNVSDWDNYVELPSSGDPTLSDYYFPIDDSRFSDTDDLMEYLKTVFTESSAKRIFAMAPQKYCDIDGSLYGVVGEGEYDYSLGTLTFSGMETSEERMLFRSRQEKFDTSGNFTGYTDGGNFSIIRQEDGSWKVSQYRYPYSFN